MAMTAAAITMAMMTAAAEAPPSPPAPAPERVTFLDAGMGWTQTPNGKHGYLVLIDVAAYHAFGPFAVGGTGTAAMKLFGEGSMSAGALAGVTGFVYEGLRLTLLGELGGHAYTGIGSGLGTKSDASATLPYVGARAQIAWHFGRSRRVSIALGMIVRDDLRRVDVSYTTHGGLFCSTCTSQHTTTVGETTIGGLLQLGVAW